MLVRIALDFVCAVFLGLFGMQLAISSNRCHDYRLLTYLMRALWIHAPYLLTKCVNKSCDSATPDWLIKTCYQSASSLVTETAFLT